jgi:hypothetical protein
MAAIGWDTEYISEDWHMLIKLFLASGGRIRVEPIFAPIVNYSTEADGIFDTLKARWEQGKRHSLGVVEVSYFCSNVVRGLKQMKEGRLLFLKRSLKLASKLIGIHICMGTMVPLAILNMELLRKYWVHERWDRLYAANLYVVVLQNLAYFISSWTHIRQVDVCGSRVIPCDKDNLWWPSLGVKWGWNFPAHLLHGAWTAYEAFAQGSIMFVMSMLCEWIAALRTIRSHRFEYVVAAKPENVKSD